MSTPRVLVGILAVLFTVSGVVVVSHKLIGGEGGVSQMRQIVFGICIVLIGLAVSIKMLVPKKD